MTSTWSKLTYKGMLILLVLVGCQDEEYQVRKECRLLKVSSENPDQGRRSETVYNYYNDTIVEEHFDWSSGQSKGAGHHYIGVYYLDKGGYATKFVGELGVSFFRYDEFHKLVKSELVEFDSLVSIQRFEYNDNSQLIKMEALDNWDSPDATSLKYYLLYQYAGPDARNALKVQNFSPDDKPFEVYSFEYDDELRPSVGGVSFDVGNINAPSVNNITRIEGPTGTVVMTYEYNHEGYPTKMTSTYNGKVGLTQQFTYDCPR